MLFYYQQYVTCKLSHTCNKGFSYMLLLFVVQFHGGMKIKDFELILSFSFSVDNYRNSHQRCSIKICVLKNFAKFTGKHLRQRFFFNKVTGLRPATLFKKTLAQVIPCEFCEISKEHLFYRTSLDDCLYNQERDSTVCDSFSHFQFCFEILTFFLIQLILSFK